MYSDFQEEISLERKYSLLCQKNVKEKLKKFDMQKKIIANRNVNAVCLVTIFCSRYSYCIYEVLLMKECFYLWHWRSQHGLVLSSVFFHIYFFKQIFYTWQKQWRNAWFLFLFINSKIFSFTVSFFLSYLYIFYLIRVQTLWISISLKVICLTESRNRIYYRTSNLDFKALLRSNRLETLADEFIFLLIIWDWTLQQTVYNAGILLFFFDNNFLLLVKYIYSYL